MRNSAYGILGPSTEIYYRLENPRFTRVRDLGTFYGYYTRVSSSGYTGKRPKPLVNHDFTYDVCDMSANFNYEIFEHRPTYFEGLSVGQGCVMKSSGSVVPSFSEGNLYNEMLSKFSDELRGGIDLSVDLGQYRQTARQFKVTQSLVDYAELLSKRWGPAKLASGLWLEYIYGWKPIVSEIYEAAERSVNVVVNKIANTRARKSWVDNNASITMDLPSFGTQKIPLDKGVKISYSMNCGFQNRKNQSISNYTSLNPVSIAWELLPYSFVVDWLYNVGGYLRTVETAMLYGNDFTGGYLDRLVAVDTDFNFKSIIGGTDRSGSYRANGHLHYRSFSRSVLTSYPFPRTPTFDVRLGSSRLFSAAALLAQHLGRR